MIAVSLFSGAGGSDLGAIAAGYTMVGAIDNWQVAVDSYRRNIGDHIICGDVASPATIREVIALAGSPIDLLMASPPCQQYSIARNNNLPLRNDADAGSAILYYVEALWPNHVIIENVPVYQHAPVFHDIILDLYNRGYMVKWRIVDFADYGIPQNRRRLILQARRSGALRWPAKRPHGGWLTAIADLIDTLPDSEFAPWQLERLANRPEYASFIVDGKANNAQRGLDMTTRGDSEHGFTIPASASKQAIRAFLIPGTNSKAAGKTIRNSNHPMVTITGSGSNLARVKFIPEGRVVRITPQALARFQTFPDSYLWPDRVADMCRLIGNAVPPLAMQRLLESYSTSDEELLCQEMLSLD